MGALLRQLLLFGVSVIRRNAVLPCSGAVAQPSVDKESGPYLSVTYNAAMQPLVEVSVGGQWLKLVFDASSGNTIVFVQEKDACVPKSLKPCYSWKKAEKNGGLHVCEENNNLQMDCETRSGSKYTCEKYLSSFKDAKAHPDALIIDGLEYDQKAVEAKDDMRIALLGSNQVYNWSSMPVRLLVEQMKIPTKHSWISMQLFEGADGILGGSGPSLSCRNQTLWSSLLDELGVSVFALDLRSPPNVTIGDAGDDSRIVFSMEDLDPAYTRDMVWSQPKQTGDLINDGMHEFLMYHPEVCGIDLLYNTSSNWLTVIDTSGPCLTLPPFFFDRLMTRIPVICPFKSGERSAGRLCSPRWDSSTPRNVTLPALYFQLEDAQDPEPPKLQLPLERLVFRNASGAELLCVARDDSDPRKATADMMYSHIALGSLAVSSLYTVVNLENHTVGLTSKGDIARESSEDLCIASVTCPSPMQTYFPPLNLCEDPQCSEYMFMILDNSTKTCKWTRAVPISFGVLLVALVVLDFASHRLYKQAIEKASEFCQ